MKQKQVLALLAIPILLTGCSGRNKAPEFTPEELEHNALVNWLEDSMTDEEKFTDLADYQFYARTIGLDKDGLLEPTMWEIYYNADININKEIDGKAVYLVRLDPYKLMDIWAVNNDMTADEVCSSLGMTADELYYNLGYTSNSIDYAKNHKKGLVSYSDIENSIFGEDNGENRKVVFGTHFLYVDTANKYKVTYESENDGFATRQRDILKATSEQSHNYSEYTEGELHSGYYINSVEINRVQIIDVPNLWSKSVEKEIDTDMSVMFNMSPYSYGCTDEDIVQLFTPVEESAESEVSE